MSSNKPAGSGGCVQGNVDDATSTTTPTSKTTTADASTSNDKEIDSQNDDIDVDDGGAIVVSKGSCVRCGKVMANRMCKLCQVSSYCSKECYR